MSRQTTLTKKKIRDRQRIGQIPHTRLIARGRRGAAIRIALQRRIDVVPIVIAG